MSPGEVRQLQRFNAEDFQKESLKFSFQEQGESVALEELREAAENDEVASLLGKPSDNEHSYTAELLNKAEEMHETAQNTDSCIAGRPEQFQKFADDPNTFFFSLRENGETIGYTRGNLMLAKGSETAYWFDTIKFPELMNSSRFERFSELYRLSILSHSKTAEMIGTDYTLGNIMYTADVDLKYSSDIEIYGPDLYPEIRTRDTTLEPASDVKYEGPPEKFPNLVTDLP